MLAARPATFLPDPTEAARIFLTGPGWEERYAVLGAVGLQQSKPLMTDTVLKGWGSPFL